MPDHWRAFVDRWRSFGGPGDVDDLCERVSRTAPAGWRLSGLWESRGMWLPRSARYYIWKSLDFDAALEVCSLGGSRLGADPGGKRDFHCRDSRSIRRSIGGLSDWLVDV